MATATVNPLNVTRRYEVAGFIVDLTMKVVGDDIRVIAQDIVNAVNEPYREIAKEEIAIFYEPDDKFTVIADQRRQVDVSESTLDGSIIDQARAISPHGSQIGRGITTARPFGKITPQLLSQVRRAYDAAMAHYKQGISKFFHPTGAYEAAVTVYQNGKKVGSPVWAEFTARSNITISPVGRKYANPLEVMKAGQLLYGAARVARSMQGQVVVNYSYRTGRSLGIATKGRGSSGSFPVLEIGLRGSTVHDSIKPPGLSRRKNKTRRRRSRRP